MKKKKAFDCVEMKRKIQEKIYRETRGMTQAEELNYFRDKVARSRFAGLFTKGRSRADAPAPTKAE